jgi:phosphoglycerate kinase
MAATFLKAKGYETGRSLVETKMLDIATGLMDRVAKSGVSLLLPVDVVIDEEAHTQTRAEIVSIDNIPEDKVIVDIGQETIQNFTKELLRCKTVFWNGPMGIFEVAKFAKGTRVIAEMIADLDAVTIIGGGSTAEAISKMGLADEMTFVSTGGGASLKFLSGESMPGIKALQRR